VCWDVSRIPFEVRQRDAAAFLNVQQEHDRSKDVEVRARFVRERIELSLQAFPGSSWLE
jgi:hypothetical protein